MKLVFITISSSQHDWLDQALSEYTKKIGYFYPIEILKIKSKKADRSDREFKIQEESKLLIEKLKTDDYIIVFDEKGKELDSTNYAKCIAQALNSSKKRIVFIIGGAFGLTDELKQKGNLKISLSRMTFNHLMALLFAVEQTYRSITILKNMPYHND